ncbi:MAG TPA: alpha/beta hydrolase-fold protein [Usitatibacter sp.]|nr:alpha/beta hydrolase-fold protein [Usitatibacter sp.]
MRFILAAALFFVGALPAIAQTFTGAMSGSWWDASRSGEGQFITFESVGTRNVVYVAYFTYTPDGRATWHVGNADYAPGATSISIPLVTGSGARFGNAFSANDVQVANAGTATLEFVSCRQMRMQHSGMAGITLNLSRLVGPLAGADCNDQPPPTASLTGVLSGSWWNASRSGEGQFVTFETQGSRNVAYVAYFTYTPEGAATWLVGNADIPIGATSITIPVITGSGARFGANFSSGDVQIQAAGSVTLTFTGCNGLTLAYSGAHSFTHSLQRLVGPLTGLGCTVRTAPLIAQPDLQQMHTLISPDTNFTYQVAVWTPPGYVAGSGLHPVIYAADMEPQVLTLKNTVRAAGYNAVVVAVGNGGPDRRFVDYTFPGANAYHRFLVHQLMPYVETQFRVDRTRRTFVGYSLSGSFAAVTLALDDPAARRWSSIISVDGSFWHQTQDVYNVEQAMFNASSSLPVKIYLVAAANMEGITAFRQRMEARGYQGLQLRQQNYALDHGAVLAPGIADGLAWVFGGN